MVERQGRFGAFIACSNYPKCKHTQPKTIPGLTCPRCGIGAVAEKRTRRGKPFWGCVRYPECEWSSWDEPIPQPCQYCDSPIVVRKSNKTRGEFIRCPQCYAEYTQNEDGALDVVSEPTRTEAQWRAEREEKQRRSAEYHARKANGKAARKGKRARAGDDDEASTTPRRVVKKAGARKAAAKKRTAKKAAAKRATAKPAPSKSVATKTADRKAAAKKPAATKTAARKSTTTKPAAKKGGSGRRRS
jgi:DNA topoisomerase-1